MSKYFLDTSAIINGALCEYANAYISPVVLLELENVKASNTKDETTKYQAREAIREIIANNNYETVFIDQRRVDRLIKKYHFLTNINDHRILCEAELTAIDNYEKITFITSDGGLFLFAQQMPHLDAIFYVDQKEKDEAWTGWGKYYPNDEQLNLLYEDPKINVLGCKTNEFAEIFYDGKLRDVLFWNGEEYRNLKYKNFTTILGEKIAPKNLEQKMYLDLLQNQEIPVKLCIAKFGTGKSFLALNHALRAIQEGRFEKIVFVKNNLEVKGAGELGTLPGDEVAKQLPWLRQIEDHIGYDKFEEYINNGMIEPAHLSTLRGRDLKNCCIIVDEAENLLDTNIQLLIGRVAENSEIIFCADVKQCDYIGKMRSGIPKMIERFAGQKLFGMVKLLKTERSATAAMADLMD